MTSHITAIFCRNHTLGSFLIRWLGAWGSSWSHVAICTESGYVIEARFMIGVVKTPISEFLARYTSHEIVPIELPDPKSALDYAHSRIGKKYDFKAILGMIIKEPLASLNRDYCNELLEDACIAGGRPRFRVPSSKVTVEQSYKVI